MFVKIPYTSLKQLYGPDQGGSISDEFFPQNSYINFGYWPHSFDKAHVVTLEERMASQAALYDHIFKHVAPAAGERIVEVGSGRGDGCARLLMKHPGVFIRGVDLFEQQIERAQTKHQKLLGDQLQFCVGAAEALPFADASVNKIYSVEAAQHFISLQEFARECARALKPNGTVVVTTFFAIDETELKNLRQLMPHNVGNAIDNVQTIETVIDCFNKAGFKVSLNTTIGQHVFPFFDQWLSQRETQDWGRLWTQAWRMGMIEYYVLIFEK